MRKKGVYRNAGKTVRTGTFYPYYDIGVFVLMCTETWLRMSDEDISRKIKVLIYCFIASSYSDARDEDREGNCFTVKDVIEVAGRSEPRMSESAVRTSISRLSADGWIKSDGGRGRYIINPELGVKGSLTERKYDDVMKYKFGKNVDNGKRIKPNEKFESDGKKSE